MSLDAITIEILRNKIASLVEEMHYHFYRSGYSTIIRESRDFSCVILDRDGRLIVAPPMFFHAPVYRHLVARILAQYGAPSDHPPLEGEGRAAVGGPGWGDGGAASAAADIRCTALTPSPPALRGATSPSRGR